MLICRKWKSGLHSGIGNFVAIGSRGRDNPETWRAFEKCFSESYQCYFFSNRKIIFWRIEWDLLMWRWFHYRIFDSFTFKFGYENLIRSIQKPDRSKVKFVGSAVNEKESNNHREMLKHYPTTLRFTLSRSRKTFRRRKYFIQFISNDEKSQRNRFRRRYFALSKFVHEKISTSHESDLRDVPIFAFSPRQVQRRFWTFLLDAQLLYYLWKTTTESKPIAFELIGRHLQKLHVR